MTSRTFSAAPRAPASTKNSARSSISSQTRLAHSPAISWSSKSFHHRQPLGVLCLTARIKHPNQAPLSQLILLRTLTASCIRMSRKWRQSWQTTTTLNIRPSPKSSLILPSATQSLLIRTRECTMRPLQMNFHLLMEQKPKVLNSLDVSQRMFLSWKMAKDIPYATKCSTFLNSTVLARECLWLYRTTRLATSSFTAKELILS